MSEGQEELRPLGAAFSPSACQPCSLRYPRTGPAKRGLAGTQCGVGGHTGSIWNGQERSTEQEAMSYKNFEGERGLHIPLSQLRLAECNKTHVTQNTTTLPSSLLFRKMLSPSPRSPQPLSTPSTHETKNSFSCSWLHGSHTEALD